MAVDRYEVLRHRVKDAFPRFNVKERAGSWISPLFWLLGKIARRTYKGFTTTVFSTIYVDPSWFKESSDARYAILRHEKMHIEQFHRWPFGRWAWPINHVLTLLCYFLLLPALWTLRARFEREGYTQTMLVQYELGGTLTEQQMEENAVWLADVFGGSAYFYMWRRRAAYAWAMQTQRRINAGEIVNPQDRVDDLRVA